MDILRYVASFFGQKEEKDPEKVEEERREVVGRLRDCAERYEQERQRVERIEVPDNPEDREQVTGYYSELFDTEPERIERDGTLRVYEQILEYEDEGEERRELLKQCLGDTKRLRLEITGQRKDLLNRAVQRAKDSDYPKQVLETVNDYLETDTFCRSKGLEPPEMPF